MMDERKNRYCFKDHLNWLQIFLIYPKYKSYKGIRIKTHRNELIIVETMLVLVQIPWMIINYQSTWSSTNEVTTSCGDFLRRILQWNNVWDVYLYIKIIMINKLFIYHYRPFLRNTKSLKYHYISNCILIWQTKWQIVLLLCAPDHNYAKIFVTLYSISLVIFIHFFTFVNVLNISYEI